MRQSTSGPFPSQVVGGVELSSAVFPRHEICKHFLHNIDLRTHTTANIITEWLFPLVMPKIYVWLELSALCFFVTKCSHSVHILLEQSVRFRSGYWPYLFALRIRQFDGFHEAIIIREQYEKNNLKPARFDGIECFRTWILDPTKQFRKFCIFLCTTYFNELMIKWKWCSSIFMCIPQPVDIHTNKIHHYRARTPNFIIINLI